MEQDEARDLQVRVEATDRKKTALRKTGRAFLIGLFIGIAVFAAVKKGFGFAFLLPLFIAFLLLRNGRRSDAEK